MPGSDDIYVLARTALLDALVVLGGQRGAVTLVGAQAIYLRVGEADIAVAPTTTDADLAFDPPALAENPALDGLMCQADFELRDDGRGSSQVGI